MLRILVLLMITGACQKNKKESEPVVEEEMFLFLEDYLKEVAPEDRPNFELSHAQGLEESGFLAEDLPFEKGLITSGSYYDGEKFDILWEKRDEFSLCEMLVTTKKDGSYIRSTSTCGIL